MLICVRFGFLGAEEHPKLLRRYAEELVPLAEPGNGIYTAVMDKVAGPQAVPPPCVPFLGSFLTALERVKSKGKSQDTADDDVAAAARVQSNIASAQQKLLKRIPVLQKGVYEWEAMNLVPRFDEFLRAEMPKLFDISNGKARNQLEMLHMEQSHQRERRSSGTDLAPSSSVSSSSAMAAALVSTMTASAPTSANSASVAAPTSVSVTRHSSLTGSSNV
jgi:hypothetical protein